MQLKDIMTKPVITVPPTASLVEAAKKMMEQDVGSIPVCDNQKLLGIITDRDITIRATAEGLNPDSTKVQDVMTQDVQTCSSGADVREACNLMEEKQIRRLVICDQNNAPIGIVSLGDLALSLREDKAGEVLEEISKPS